MIKGKILWLLWEWSVGSKEVEIFKKNGSEGDKEDSVCG